MSQVTVRQLAEVVGVPVERLIEQLGEAGMTFQDPDAPVSNKDKMRLLEFLRESHGKSGAEVSGPSRVTIKRKSVTELRVPAAAGRAKTVNVEVRKKRTYVKRSAVETSELLDPDREEARRKLAEVHSARDAEAAKVEQDEAERKLKEDAAAKLIEEEQALKAAEETAEAERRDSVAAEEKAAAERERLEVEEKARLEAIEKERLESAEKARQKQTVRDVQKAKKGRHKGRGGAGHDTRYGRNELHVAAGKSGLRKSRRPARKTFDAPEQHGFSKPTAPVIKEIDVPESITVAELSQKLAIKAPEVIKVLMGMGMMVTVNQPIDQDTAILVVEELGHKAKAAEDKDLEARLMDEYRAEIGEQSVRPPVVTVMGHVDHGKTSLLDHIRHTRVTEGEAGGITQHIGAYHVQTDKGVITFLDTPGHAAFTAMRARGAQATDIVILVVAADDGVMPQTVEAIKHARAAGVPIIVAINKIDRPEADVERARQELSKHEVIPEDWGGEDIFVNVSAKTGEGIDDLLDAILLQAELQELVANPDARASGVVVESTLDKGRGPVATILVQNGTLRKGEMLLAGQEFGRVRAMFNEAGEPVESAGPSIPVVVLGLSGTPMAGEDVLVVNDEKHAKEAAEDRKARIRDARLAKQQAAKLENLFERMTEEQLKQVNLLIKADVQGSAEALKDAMTGLSNERVNVNVILSGVGGITESDATFAQASGAIVIGFNVRADASARRIIQEAEIDLHYYSVIYDAIDEVKKAITGLLGTEVKEQILGLAEVKDVFRSSKLGAIAGCLVLEGVVRSDNPIRVLRDNVVIFEGELESLRRFKDEVKEVKSGVECGIGVKQYNDIKPGDQIECFERIEVAITLD